jgi:hypothetical protein
MPVIPASGKRHLAHSRRSGLRRHDFRGGKGSTQPGMAHLGFFKRTRWRAAQTAGKWIFNKFRGNDKTAATRTAGFAGNNAAVDKT